MSQTKALLPQFYRQPEPMQPDRHGKLSLDPKVRFDFAAKAVSVPISAAEAPLVSRHYPIVFASAGEFLPLAVLGLESESNLFVDGEGAWEPNVYIPAYVRRYPFILAASSGDGGGNGAAKDDRMTLCVDRASSRVAEGEGEAFFDDGKPSLTTNNALEFCVAFEREIAETRRIVALLRKHEVLKPNEATLTLTSGARLELRDFLVVDAKAVDALPDKAFAELRRQSALPLLFAHVNSRIGFSELGRRLSARTGGPGAAVGATA